MKLDHGELTSILHGAGPRSPHFERIKNEYLRVHPNCEADAKEYFGRVCVQVHHIFAFHVCILLGRPDLELDPCNFLGLCENEPGKPCENHHVLLGHLGDFQVNNDSVLADIKTYQGMTHQFILASGPFASRMLTRPKPFPDWTAQERVDYRKMLDAKLPPDPILCAKYGFKIVPYAG